MANPYYHPVDFGLEVVGAVEWRDADYEFDLGVVWKDEKGNFFYATDSGCSCPTPFDDMTMEDLAPALTFFDVVNILSEELEDRGDYVAAGAHNDVVDIISSMRNS